MTEPDDAPVAVGDRGPWRLMRQDDNGNRYAVAEYPTRDAAAGALGEFEARGHKQIYRVESVRTSNA
ncbi:MAG TPA: SPOR domain-containing protein [Actinocrinis sp.]|nr:SPOR domain-containing protein [Actinocrinis sp.]